MSFVLLFLKKLILCSLFSFKTSYLERLFYFSHYELIWYFFQKCIFWKKGVIITNLNLSYDFWLVTKSVSFISTHVTIPLSFNVSCTRLYVKNVRIFNFFSKYRKLNLSYILIFMLTLRFNFIYVNINRLLYPYLILTSEILFFSFNNYFYFRIYNY